MNERLYRIKKEFPKVSTSDIKWLIEQAEHVWEPELINHGIRSQRHYMDVFYEAFGKPPTAIQVEDIRYWIDLGMEEGMLSSAFEKTGRAGAGFNYAIGILRKWHKAGIMTLKQVEKEGRKRREKIHDENREGDSGDAGGGYYW